MASDTRKSRSSKSTSKRTVAKKSTGKRAASGSSRSSTATRSRRSTSGRSTSGRSTSGRSTSGRSTSGRGTSRRGSSSSPSDAEWGRIYARAWTDDKFRNLLETDPTKALKKFAKENGLQWDKLVRVEQEHNSRKHSDARLQSVARGEETYEKGPVACC